MVAITLVKIGLVPSKISALGIEFTKADQQSLLFIVALITAYSLVAFTVYAVADFIAWRLAFVAAWQEIYEQERRDTELRSPRFSPVLHILSRPVILIRPVLEFFLPILLGIYAIVIILLRAPAP